MKRKLIQAAALLLSNGYVPGFIRGVIYKGPLKNLCVPGLNCYSCPGALGACPIGALQAVSGSVQYNVSLYVIGYLGIIGLLMGRLVCGYLCPFGLIQEGLHKIPCRKFNLRARWPRFVKYFVLLVFVIFIPTFITNRFGLSDPAFCKYICPAGTLTAGLPLIALQPGLRASLGGLFALKVAIAAITVIGCMVMYRLFCRVLCPLGAIYSVFNSISLYRMGVDEGKCTDCGACEKACKMGVNPKKAPNSPECIRCGACKKACSQNAITTNWIGRRQAGIPKG